MILTPDESQADNSEFRLFLQRPINLNPAFEWEVGMVDTYIESTISSATEKMSEKYEEYWFRYIYEVGGNDIDSYLTNMQKINYSSHQKHYYNPREYNSSAESFVEKINDLTRSKDSYGEFSKQGYPQTLVFRVANDRVIIKVIREMAAPNETVLIQMPPDQFKDVFGSDVKYWETFYKGEKLEYSRLLYEIHSNCLYLKDIDCLAIIATDVNIYRTIEQHAPYRQGFLGVEFRSPTKIKRHTKTQMQKLRKNIMIDIECNLIETTRIGQTNGGTQVLGVCNVDGNTIINPKYFPVETRLITSIYIKMYKSSDKSQIVIAGRPYIVINIRPKSFC